MDLHAYVQSNMCTMSTYISHTCTVPYAAMPTIRYCIQLHVYAVARRDAADMRMATDGDATTMNASYLLCTSQKCDGNNADQRHTYVVFCWNLDLATRRRGSENEDGVC